MGPAQKVARVPFPEAAEFSGVGLFKDSVLTPVSPDEFEAGLEDAKSDGRKWKTDTGKVAKKTGLPILQSREGPGLYDCYFSFPPWVTEFLARLVESGEIDRASSVVGASMSAVAEGLETRTGYKAVGVALHPDSRTALGFHVQYQTASGGKLLGRSADGRKGRKGVRLLGDAMLGVSRFGAFVELDAKAREAIKKKDFDDVALDVVLMKTLEEELGDDWATVMELGKVYSEAWKKQRDEALAQKKKVERAEREAKSLKKENLSLKGRLAKLEKEIKALGGMPPR